MKDIHMGQRLKSARESKGLKQQEVCDKLGIPKPQTISAYERGENNPPVETLKKLSALYDVSIDWIVLGEDRSRKNKDTLTLLSDFFHAADELGFSFEEEFSFNDSPTGRHVIALVSSKFSGITSLVHDLYKLYGLRDILDKDDYDMLVNKKMLDHATKSNNFEPIRKKEEEKETNWDFDELPF